MHLGYARVSTHEQTLDLQIDALIKAGCTSEDIYTEKVSAAASERVELAKLLSYARKGDTIVVWRLDRLGRNLKQLIEIVNDLEERGVGLKSLTEEINTTTSGGKLIFHMFGALAEFERNIIRERTLAGLSAARARGRVGGRPHKMSSEQIKRMQQLYDERKLSINEICKTFGIARTTLYKYIKR